MSTSAIQYLNHQNNQEHIRKKEEFSIINSKTAPSLLILMGSMDWLTTIVGIVYFGAVEGNPLIADLTRSNLVAFSALKLGAAFIIGFMFYQAEKTLNRNADRKSRGFTRVRYVLRGAYIACITFLIAVVANNVLIVANGAI